MTNTMNPRIYVACLASYNNGILHGDWIEIDGWENIQKRISEILKSSSIPSAEEWAVHDHELCGHLGEYPGLDTLEAIQNAFVAAERNFVEWEPFVAYCEHLGELISRDQILNFQEAYAGTAECLETWCERFLCESGQLDEIPERFQIYFDIEKFSRDMEINNVFTIEHNGEVFVFWRR